MSLTTAALISPTPTSSSTSSSFSSSTQAASSTVLLVSLLPQGASSTVLYISPLATSYPLSTTSASVAPSSTTSTDMALSTLGPNSPINCPSDNGRNFTDTQGLVYQIQCDTDHGGDDIGNEVAASFQQCIADCFAQQNHDCIGVAWVPSRSFANCYFKGDRNTLPASASDVSLGFAVHSAVLVSAPPCTSLSCPANTSQYCMSNGELFKMSCEIAYMTEMLAGMNVATIGECIDSCSSGWPGVCNGVTFFAAQYRPPTAMSFPSSNCYPFSVGNNPVSYTAANGGSSALTRNARNAGYGLWRRELDDRPHLETRQSSNITTVDNSTAGNVTYAAVFDTTNTLDLNAADDGNLFVGLLNSTTQSSNTTWSFMGQSIFGDNQDRLLHYFPDSITAVGASRLRLAAWGSIPETAQLINLAPISAGSTNILVAVDTLGNYFWLYVCAIQDQQNKIFLVNDPANGEGLLQDPSLKFTVTGGIVNDCAALALTAANLTSIS